MENLIYKLNVHCYCLQINKLILKRFKKKVQISSLK